jgi:hypothetical protein
MVVRCARSMGLALINAAAHRCRCCTEARGLQHAFGIVEAVGGLLPCFGGKHSFGRQEREEYEERRQALCA